MDFNTAMADILADVWPSAGTVLWNFRALIVFFLAVLLAFAAGLWIRSLVTGGD